MVGFLMQGSATNVVPRQPDCNGDGVVRIESGCLQRLPVRGSLVRYRAAACSAWLRSARMSSICSMPIDRRTMSWLTPARASSSALS
ncbi:hypothetical protein D3C80_1923790 [compost metagenome]